MSDILGDFTKAPTEVLDYTIDFGQLLLVSGALDPIASVVWNSSPSGLQLDTPSPVATPTLATVFASSGTDGQAYTVLATVTTVAGRVFVRGFTLNVGAP